MQSVSRQRPCLPSALLVFSLMSPRLQRNCHKGRNVNDVSTTERQSLKIMHPKNSKSNESRQAKNGGVKGRDGSAVELDRETGEEQITVGWTRRKDGR